MYVGITYYSFEEQGSVCVIIRCVTINTSKYYKLYTTLPIKLSMLTQLLHHDIE